METDYSTIVSMHQGESGLEVRTRAELDDADCVTLVCALALNLSHGRRLSAEQLLDAARGSVGALRNVAGRVTAVRGVE